MKNSGLIEACNNHAPQCKYKCCKFSDNYIVLYPGEFEKSKLNKNHLRIVDDDYLGGKKAVCTKHCTKDDFKPVDCQTYPYFPKIDQSGNIEILIGKKCPLVRNELINHRKEFFKFWRNLIKNNQIREWVRNVQLIGYKPEK